MESRLLTIKFLIMKTLIYCILFATALCLTSCFGDSRYGDTFFVRNSSAHHVKCYIKAEPEEIIGIMKYPNVEPSNSSKEGFFALGFSAPSSSFDNNSEYIININDININMEITFVFDDTLRISYHKEDLYDNNPCHTKNWEVTLDIDKKHHKYHDALYIITEENYLDALKQSKN